MPTPRVWPQPPDEARERVSRRHRDEQRDRRRRRRRRAPCSRASARTPSPSKRKVTLSSVGEPWSKQNGTLFRRCRGRSRSSATSRASSRTGRRGRSRTGRGPGRSRGSRGGGAGHDYVTSTRFGRRRSIRMLTTTRTGSRKSATAAPGPSEPAWMPGLERPHREHLRAS